jgi:uncharacterized protein YdhG (YjbR/CyaY superfamily)
MTSRAPDVETYIEELPPERRAAVEKLRGLCRRTLKGYEECMDYGMPCYKRYGVTEVGFASQKQCVSLYVLKREVVDEFRAALPASSIGKGCIRFRKPEAIDFEAIGRMLRRSVESSAEAC